MSEPAAKIPKIADNLLCDDSGSNSGYLYRPQDRLTDKTMSDVLQINRRSDELKMLQNYEQEDAFGFIVRLCHDVFLEVLIFGDRRRLTKLERVGRRFHLSIENFFKERPFLRFYLRIYASRDGIADISGLAWPQKLSPNELQTIPPFLRFDNVRIWCHYDDLPIDDKCKFIKRYLLPIKQSLIDSNVVKLAVSISENNRSHFSDHSMLLDFIRNRFLPICNSSRRYKFQIWFHSDRNSDTDVIASILEMDEIKHCSNVKIGIRFGEQKRLPVEEILNWLEASDDRTNNSLQSLRERFLEIYYPDYGSFIQNAREMLEHLTKKFVEAKSPAQPFTFRFRYCDVKALGIEAQNMTNKKTGEELSVNIFEEGLDLDCVEIEIKRARKEKREKKN